MNQERLYKVLLGPVVSEKAAAAGDASNQVVFKVLPSAIHLLVKLLIIVTGLGTKRDAT